MTWRIEAIRHVGHPAYQRSTGSRRASPGSSNGFAPLGSSIWPRMAATPHQTDLGDIVTHQRRGHRESARGVPRTPGSKSFVNTGSSSEYGFKDHPAAEDGGARTEQLLRGGQGLGHASSAAMWARTRRIANPDLAPLFGVRTVRGPEPPRACPHRPRLARTAPALDSPPRRRVTSSTSMMWSTHFSSPRRLDGSDPGAIYNVGSGIQTSLRRPGGARAPGARHRHRAPSGDRCRAGRGTPTCGWPIRARFSAELGWRPTRSMAQGFTSTLAWLRADHQLRRLYQLRLGDPGSS